MQKVALDKSSVTLGDGYERMRMNGNMPAITANTPDGSAKTAMLNTPPSAINTPKTAVVFMISKSYDQKLQLCDSTQFKMS